MNVTWAIANSTLTLNYSAQGFRLNRTTLTSWTATAVVTSNGNARTLAWTADLSGSTPSGRDFTRHAEKNIGWTVGTACIAMTGTAEGTVTGDTLKTTISSYSRCAGACPQAGSDIDIDNETTGEERRHPLQQWVSLVTASGKEATGELTIALACLRVRALGRVRPTGSRRASSAPPTVERR